MIPPIVHTDDPLILGQWPIHIWERCNLYRPNLPSPLNIIDSVKDGAIVYWIQNTYFCMDNLALQASVYLGSKLNVPVIAIVLVHESELNDVTSVDTTSPASVAPSYKDAPSAAESFRQKSWYKLSALSAFEEELVSKYGIPVIGLMHQDSNDIVSSTVNTVATFVGNLSGTSILIHSLTHSPTH